MLSLAAVQSRLTLGVVSADAVNEPGAEGFTPSMIWTLTPLVSEESVLNERPDTGSVSVLPGSRGASYRSAVAGVVSMRSVCFAVEGWLAVPAATRMVTPVTGGDPPAKVSKLP